MSSNPVPLKTRRAEGPMHVKSVESSNVLPLLCGVVKRGWVPVQVSSSSAAHDSKLRDLTCISFLYTACLKWYQDSNSKRSGYEFMTATTALELRLSEWVVRTRPFPSLTSSLRSRGKLDERLPSSANKTYLQSDQRKLGNNLEYPLASSIRPDLQNVGSANRRKSERAKFEIFNEEEGVESTIFFTKINHFLYFTISINHERFRFMAVI
ncbi:hypothetical protein TNCV_155281 [Trichonephila clavipes]|uniref:Uncharacterized protein n=1 Tax=Trichonephila clavipes TaxID=2585209 RepID=A0A8X6WHI7_TRICX|nr:hypothetical protein TNCV_155281 [Trichonephila clavipes]